MKDAKNRRLQKAKTSDFCMVFVNLKMKTTQSV